MVHPDVHGHVVSWGQLAALHFVLPLAVPGECLCHVCAGTQKVIPDEVGETRSALGWP